MKPRLSAIAIAVSAASLLAFSTAGVAAHKRMHENYKAETNYKAEVPAPCPPVLVLRDGFYLGVGVGYDSYRIHHSNDFVATELSVVPSVVEFTSASSHTGSATGWMGGIFAGYGRYFDTLYLALEINANTSNADSVVNYNDSFGNVSHVKVRARSSYGIALLPGVKVNDSSLLYVRLGWLRTNFKGTADYTQFDLDELTLNSVSASHSAWRNGFNFGVGIETAIACDVSIRGEFTHTSFNNKTASATFVNTTTADSITTTDKFDVSNNEFMLSAIYHFDFV